MTIAQQLQKAIDECGQTRYHVAKHADIDYYALARFLDEGRDIRLSTVQKLADYFGMRLTQPIRRLKK